MHDDSDPTPVADGPLCALIADDNEINRIVITEMLSHFGVRSVEAAGGEEAIALRTEHDFDLLLLDISMPNVDGPAALKAIRESEARLGLPRAPAVACTAHALPEDAAALVELGFDACLIKPLTLEAVADVLRATCGLP
ncbi:response regulator [Rubrimonas cliftonensis]|uniref:Two-component system, NarL family, sensor histidine kinase EvgS n=1 Tax=Rubrimonas cliftonensis TaxID=89524 RepID=A0A1H4DWE6_9RHOB|nr:response regulator [Rubrimonas cliftonensis]SEA76916.1 two-component system, NarL family, sensor histidine kinase EvgS [Rubrimonas cliftonensis]